MTVAFGEALTAIGSSGEKNIVRVGSGEKYINNKHAGVRLQSRGGARGCLEGGPGLPDGVSFSTISNLL